MPRSFAGDGVQIEGLADLQRTLRALAGPDATRTVLKTANANYADFIVSKAVARAEGYGGVRAFSSGGISARSEQRYAIVRMDGNAVPTLFGAEFGSLQYHQFPGWTGNRWTNPPDETSGYFLHPTIAATAEDEIDLYVDELDLALADAFPDGHL